jgi:ferritin-like metal-binding protein YciE
MHAARLEPLFAAVGSEISPALSHALEGLQRAHDTLAPSVVEPRLKDLFLADGAIRTEHLEIALYSSLIPLAQQLGVSAEPLERNLGEERRALEELERAAAKLRGKLPG